MDQQAPRDFNLEVFSDPASVRDVVTGKRESAPHPTFLNHPSSNVKQKSQLLRFGEDTPTAIVYILLIHDRRQQAFFTRSSSTASYPRFPLATAKSSTSPSPTSKTPNSTP